MRSFIVCEGVDERLCGPAVLLARWTNKRSAIAGSRLVAADGGIVYGYSRSLYAVHARDGSYVAWGEGGSPDLPMREVLFKTDIRTSRPEGASATTWTASRTGLCRPATGLRGATSSSTSRQMW